MPPSPTLASTLYRASSTEPTSPGGSSGALPARGAPALLNSSNPFTSLSGPAVRPRDGGATSRIPSRGQKTVPSPYVVPQAGQRFARSASSAYLVAAAGLGAVQRLVG